MNYKELGKTGLQVAPVIFGTSALGNLYTTLGDDTKQEIVTNCYRNVPVFDSAGK
jgi:D-threo-aldose 1-dehydrogenase